MSEKPLLEIRDDEVGAALRLLETPEHAPGFERRLRARLHRPRSRLRWGVRAAAVAAAATVAVLAIGLPRTERTPSLGGPAPARAADVQRAVRSAFAALHNLGGVLVSEETRTGATERWRFVLDSNGDFRLSGLTLHEEIAYDAEHGIARSVERSASMPGSEASFYAERRGVAPGPPDQGPPTWILLDEYGAYVRALLAAADPRLRPVTYAGRPAWRLDVPGGSTIPGAALRIIVDRATGIPVRVDELRGSATVRVLRLEEPALDSELAPDAFDLAFPAGVAVMRSDEGFRRVGLGDVAARIGYAPLVPAAVPEGFRLADVAVAEHAAPTADLANPPSERVVSLLYRRGVDSFVVATRAAGDGTWHDPFETGAAAVAAERVALRRGALAGTTVELTLEPRSLPHLWTTSDGLVVTVGGDLTRAQLLDVAESLAPR